MSSHASPYIGRFAPSPTGSLHFGSLAAALASFLDAKAHDGRWLLRVEDIDPPREQPGATTAILKSLEAHHLSWDGDVLYQNERSDAYRAALQILEAQQLSYRCTCSRQTLALPDEPHLSPNSIYSGHCRDLQHSSKTVSAIRLNIEKSLQILELHPVIHFDDVWQGFQKQDLLNDVGDFVIHRKDNLFAYQLAVVVDDIFQNVTHVIRGADLLDSTARQILLFRLFNAEVPVFGHAPLVLNAQGQKLSKQNLAPPLDDSTPAQNIFSALQFLQLNPPPELQHESVDTVLRWAITNSPK
jgi:glutamyl-Q tRNA(Asp) synthetase